MEAMAALAHWAVTSGAVVGLALAVLVAEWGFLVLAAPWRQRGRLAVEFGISALPGLFLLLALGAGLRGAGAGAVLLLLAASLPAHAADTWRRRRLYRPAA